MQQCQVSVFSTIFGPSFDPNEWCLKNGLHSGGLNPGPLGHESSALTTRPVVLKPGVATHLCVAKVLGCVAKRFLNLWANQKKYIAAVTAKVFAERNFIINIIGFMLSISLFFQKWLL
jgi:hypothetical protein